MQIKPKPQAPRTQAPTPAAPADQASRQRSGQESDQRFAYTRDGEVVCKFCGWPARAHTFAGNGEPLCVAFDSSLLDSIDNVLLLKQQRGDL